MIALFQNMSAFIPQVIIFYVVDSSAAYIRFYAAAKMYPRVIWSGYKLFVLYFLCLISMKMCYRFLSTKLPEFVAQIKIAFWGWFLLGSGEINLLINILKL